MRPTSHNPVARENRDRFKAGGTLALNLVGSPGSGKTALIERTVQELQMRLSIGMIKGDLVADTDVRKIERYGVPATTILTRGRCHLEAVQIRDAFLKMAVVPLELLFIENVGDRHCPTTHDLGESMRVVVLSTAEGDDAPTKYPFVFERATVLVINKMDLLPFLTFDVEAVKKHALEVNPHLLVFQTSCTLGHGLREWNEWLLREVRALQEWPVVGH